MSFQSEKEGVRAQMVQKILALGADDRQDQDRELCDGLELWWQNRGRPPLWAFFPFQTEPRFQDFLTRVWNLGHPMGFPRLGDQGMEFLQVSSPEGPWATHRWGMKEPQAGLPVWAALTGVILVPGLAFDPRGGRLGRGGGFYDRFLSALPRTVYRLGIGYRCQFIPSVPRLDHDQTVDGFLGPGVFQDLPRGSKPAAV